jgi:hypothetical protein
MATLTIHHYLDIIDSFVQNVTNTSKSYYLFVGRPNPWVNGDGNIDDTAITPSNGSIYQHESSTYQDIVYGKLIEDTNVSFMIKRYDWVQGTVYDQYDQFDGEMYNVGKYFVMTDNYDVFKCIDNNNGAPSLIKPALNATYGTFMTGDGYTWKFMFHVETNANSVFTSPSFIPVTPNTDVVNNAVGGTVDVIRVKDGGHGYKTYYSGFLKSVSNNYHVILDQNAVHHDDYYTGSSMYLKAGFGAGQIREITYYQGLSRTVRLKTPFDTFITFNVSDITGSLYVGDIITQNVDVLDSSYFTGAFNPGDNIVQTETGANGTIITANTTEVRVIRNSPANEFVLNLPYRNTIDTAIQKSGNATVKSFDKFVVVSNTGTFINGEYIYQTNSTGNAAVGILYSANVTKSFYSNSTSIDTINDFIYIPNNTFEDNDTVLYYTAAGNVVFGLTKSFNANTSVNGDIDFISITNNPFDNEEQLLYVTRAGNTVISGLANNTMYYVVQSNSSGLKLASTLNGANINITASVTSETGHQLTRLSLANNTLYYVVQSNTTGVKLSDSRGGANLNLVAGINNEAGHYLTQKPMILTVGRSNGQFYVNSIGRGTLIGNTSGAQAVINSISANTEGRKLVYSTNTSYTNFTSQYKIHDFIRIGNDANNYIRRITAVNTSVITLDSELPVNLVSNTHWLQPTAAEPIGIGKMYSNGTISNTNLNGIILNIGEVVDVSIPGVSYFVGETVDMIDPDTSQKQGVTATVSFANSSSLVLTDVNGTFQPDYYLLGDSSYQIKKITDVIAYPTITIKDPINHFLIGQKIFARSSVDLTELHGTANVISFYVVPNELTEYMISPTVTIDGDGEGALAYSIVNDAETSTNNISKVIVINPGHRYTHANVVITANGAHGHGANHGSVAVISPVRGHGSDALSELGCRYVGVSMEFDTAVNEDYKFPVYGEYRRIGIIENPLFEDVYVTLDSFERATFGIDIYSGEGFVNNEIVIQPNTNFAGIVTFANSGTVELKNIKGEYSNNGYYANGKPSNSDFVGLLSNTYAQVTTANINYFTVSPGVEIASEFKSGANAVVVAPLSNTYIKITEVNGRFDANDTIYDTLSNAYANVTGIYTVNGSVDVTSNFGKKFNQSLRLPLTANTLAFEQFEYVRQDTTNTVARVINTNESDYDIKFIQSSEGASVSFNIDNTITDSYSGATAKVIFANSTYLRITGSNGVFGNNNTITNQLNDTLFSVNVFPVIVMNDVSGANKFQANVRFNGLTSRSSGICDMYDTIVYPELVRDTGVVTYLENLEPFEVSNTSKEKFKLVIKF